jgi:hypothetical protein
MTFASPLDILVCFFKDMNRAGKAQPYDMGKSQPGIFHLPFVGFPPEMRADFINICYAGGP